MEMLLDVPTVQKVRHPAKYTDALLPVFANMLKGRKRILDPMAGTGKVFELQSWLPNAEIQGIEIEPEWCAMNPHTTLGNALCLPWRDNYFDAIVNSPTYSNRMADHHEAKDDSRRNTYRHALGRALHPDNSGQLQWGRKYCEFHYKAWTEAKRVLCPGGLFVLNIKDHIRAGKRIRVTLWHMICLQGLGFQYVTSKQIETPSNRQGANGDLRLPYESVILFRLEDK